MHIVQRLLISLALTQLSACAVISKEECLNADWKQLGFNVGINGNINKVAAFEKRKRTCEKHNLDANWQQFELGHTNGILEFCQINNAVNVGIKGRVSIINNNVCPESDYPGFLNAFNAGYKLYELDTLVEQSETDITHAYNNISFKKQTIKRIDKDLSSKNIDKSKRNHLISERRRVRKDIEYLSYEIRSYQKHLRRVLYSRDDYADYLYNDYLNLLDNSEIASEKKKSVYIKKPNP